MEIAYSVAVMGDIHAAVRAALLQAPEVETGGVFFGTHSDRAIRIETWRPIACEHSQGPSLIFTGRDRVELACLIEVARRSADLKELEPLGWFVSHPRTGVSLTPSDIEIYNGFFPYPWQVTLALQPATNGKTRAGFFAREAGGNLRSAASYLEFELEPVDVPAPVASSSIFSWAESSQSSEPPAENKLAGPPASYVPPAGPRAVTPHPQDVSEPRGSIEDAPVTGFWSRIGRLPAGWLWAIPVLLVLAVGAVLLLKQRSSPSLEPFSLRVFDSQRTLQVEWDRNTPLMSQARTAVLDIRDGGKSTRYAMSPDEIHAGSMSYVRQTGDVDLVMTVYPATGPAVQGFGRLLAPPDAPANKAANTGAPSGNTAAPPNAPGMEELRAERDALRDQVARLEEQVRKEAAEKNRLQDLTRILENRLQIGGNPTPRAEIKQDK